MTKLSLYARLLPCLVWALAPAGSSEAGQSSCAPCLVMTIGTGQALLLPDNLHGLVVLIQPSEGMTPDLAAGIARVRERRGRPAVLVRTTAANEADLVFATKLRLTDLRSTLPSDVPLALEEPAGTDPVSFAAALGSYADVIVSRREGHAPAGRRWRMLGRASLGTALARTREGGPEAWVLEIPADVVEARDLITALVEAAAPPPDMLIEEVEVRATSPLTAAEIVARHQAAARRQAAAVRTVVSTGTLTLVFEAPGFPAPLTIVTDTVIYQGAGRTELEQRRIRVNGLAFEGSGVPRLPIVEPERVASPPLAISLSTAYRYARAADETVRGIRCHVVTFEPAGSGPAFRGRAWIAVDGFHLVRVAAAQTGLRGAVVSSEQTDDFAEVTPGVWLLQRSDVRQLYEGAAHRTPIHRVLAVTAVEVNPPDFDARLLGAYRSTSVMLRETADGYRYLRRQAGPAEGTSGEGGAPAVAIAEARADRVRTLAAGVIIDPNISIPLPFAGLNYVDFNLFGTGTQVNAFFGGSYGQLALSVPSLVGTRWQLGARAFAIASSYNDRAFRGGREIFDENVRQRPAHGAIWLLRPLGPRLALRAGYELDYTRLRAAPETAPDFVVPADSLAHGIRIAMDGQRGGWAGSVWWNAARRTGWQPWGLGPGFDAAHGDFQRFGALLSRSTTLTPAFVTRVEAAVMGGRDLDRFSRYSFGTFDNRLRGYPAALVRYDRGGVVRGAVAWSASRFARIDGFLDSALVRDRGFGTGYRSYTGAGAAVEAPLPLGILGAAEWGYGFRGVNTDGSRGTHIIRVSAFKVF